MPYVRQRTRIQLAPRSLSRLVAHGMGDAVIPGGPGVGPVSPDIQAAYNAGLAMGAGGTPGIDLSQGFSSADAQAAFVAGYQAAQSPGNTLPVGTALPAGPIASPVGAGSFQQWFQQNQNLVVWGGAGLFALLLLKKALG